jgi:formylglycine-generating enzyme required for sulfatase activity
MVVVKALHAGDLERGVKDVFREAIVLRQLNHPAIIGVRDCEYADPTGRSRPYIVMDYFPGGTLEEFVGQRDVLAPDHLVAVARAVAAALQATHARGILHRDLKPRNILVRKEGDRWLVKVIDFGLALRRQSIDSSVAVASYGKTILSESAVGTLRYAPPEQLGELAGVRPGPYSDVYAFGKTCCYALFKTAEPKSRHWSSVPRELAEVLERCTEAELEYRLADFGPVLEVLEALDHERQQEEQRRQRERVEAERQRRAAEEERQRVAALRAEGLATLRTILREALDRGQGKIPEEMNAAVADHCRRHHISAEEAKTAFPEACRRWEEDRPHVPRSGEPLTNSLGIKLVLVPRGTFWMGDRGRQQQVEIPHDFYMGAFSVTQEQWQAVMGSNPSDFSRSRGRAGMVKGFSEADLKQFPVEQVSWDDVQEFLKRLNAREKDSGFLYRLPTEAEWEYSCRGGASSQQECNFDFYFGDPSRNLSHPTNDLYSKQANFNGNHPAGNAPKGKYLERTTKVGSYKPNRLGIYDMHGNVWEWCEDHSEVGASARVIRGGSWLHHGSGCRASSRGRDEPGIRHHYLGFRVAAVPSGE